HPRLAGVEDRNRDLIIEKQLSKLGGLNKVRLISLLAFKEEECLVALERCQLLTAIARVVGIAIGLLPQLQFFMGEDGSMHIKMDHMIVAAGLLALQTTVRGF